MRCVAGQQGDIPLPITRERWITAVAVNGQESDSRYNYVRKKAGTDNAYSRFSYPLVEAIRLDAFA